MNILGQVFNIQKCSLHDGPGIRTLIFLAGCPLRCTWCSNPEGLKLSSSLYFIENLCSFCQKCQSSCPHGVHSFELSSKKHLIERDQCLQCEKCVNACPHTALRLSSSLQSCEEVVNLALQDRIFYQTSGGGITIGGGDPLFQSDFTLSLLQSFKEEKIHTAIETSGCFPFETMEKMLPYLDLILIDLKHMNSELHQKFTGRSNGPILETIKKLLLQKVPLIIRIPLIPGFNDSEENLRETAIFIEQNNTNSTLLYVEFLYYHEWGKGKYEQLGLPYHGPVGVKIKSDNIKDFYFLFLDRNIKIKDINT